MKLTYVHINKTAGSSFHFYAKENNILLYNCKRGDHEIFNKDGEYSKTIENNVMYVATVRNPYTRTLSNWLQWIKLDYLNDETASDFNVYINKLITCFENNTTIPLLNERASSWSGKENMAGFRFVQPCTYWIKDLLESLNFKWFKFENLEEYDKFFEEKNIKIKKKCMDVVFKKTVTMGNNVRWDLLTKDNIKIINDLYADDFDNFDYERR
ncbi:MAG: hypothetical protein ACW98D_13750 [Promethearchaeota archaeon]|jgi:hypothetical protein